MVVKSIRGERRREKKRERRKFIISLEPSPRRARRARNDTCKEAITKSQHVKKIVSREKCEIRKIMSINYRKMIKRCVEKIS